MLIERSMTMLFWITTLEAGVHLVLEACWNRAHSVV
jgi:hypothetical protein